MTDPGQEGLRYCRTQHKRREPEYSHAHSSKDMENKVKKDSWAGGERKTEWGRGLTGARGREREREKHRLKLNMKDSGQERRPRPLRVSDRKKEAEDKNLEDEKRGDEHLLP